MFSSMSLRSLRTVSALEVVQPIWSVYVSTSSDSLLALRPSLIFILRLRFFFPPMGGCPGFPFFGVGGRFVGLVLGGVGLLFGGGLACGFGVGGAFDEGGAGGGGLAWGGGGFALSSVTLSDSGEAWSL